MLILCFLSVSASFSGDGARGVGGAPSLVDLQVMLGREGGRGDPVLVLGRAGGSCQMSVSHRSGSRVGWVGTVGGRRMGQQVPADSHELVPLVWSSCGCKLTRGP